jgi:hypothetical protein
VLAQENIGGSAECQSMITEGHAAVAEMLADPSLHASLVETFDVCAIDGLEDPLSVLRNQQLFAGDGLLYIPAQGNDPSCTGELCDIASVCSSILSDPAETPLEALTRVVAVQNGGNCANVDWEANIKLLQSPASKWGGTRSWLYQTCNEFGFYQTCDADSECPYAKGYHPIDQDLEMCERVFGIKSDAVEQNVADSLDFYGGWNLNGTRILFVNGDVDPWSTLSVTPTNPDITVISEDLPAFWVEAASHHFWTHEVLDTDSQQVVDGREKIYAQVQDWLEME